MKKFFILSLLAMIIAIGKSVHAQSFHTQYEHTAGFPPVLSMVVVSDPTTYTNYMIGTDYHNRVFISPLSTDLPSPMPTNLEYFDLPVAVMSNIGQVYFQKGLIHPNSGDIFLYGFAHKNNAITACFAIIEISNGQATKCHFRHLQGSNRPIESACWANHPSPISTNSAYGIIYEGKLYRIFVVNPSSSTFIINTGGFKNIDGYYIKSVDYDGSNNKFVVSASQLPIPGDTTPIRNQIIAHIDNNNSFAYNSFTIHRLNIDNNFCMADRTSKVFLEGNDFYYTNYAFLIHDVYSANDLSDGFWLTKINYLTGNIDQSRVYIAKDDYLYKILVTDAVDNFDKIFVLGTFVSNKLPINEVKRCVLQIDISNYNNSILKSMDDYDIVNINPLYPTHPPYYTKLHPMGYMNGLIFNNLYYDVIGFGSLYNLYSYLVEIMDLNNSIDGCEHEVDLITYTPDILVENFTYSSIYQSINLGQYTPATITGQYALTWETLCSHPSKSTEYFANNRKEHIQRIIDENMKKYPQKKSLLEKDNYINYPKIQVFNNKFICIDFEGECKFNIYDFNGRIVQTGITQNYELNNIEIKKNGMYLIKITDDSNNTISNKIIITNN